MGSWHSGDHHFEGRLSCGSFVTPVGSLTGESLAGNANIPRSAMAQEALAQFSIPLTTAKTWDALGSDLPLIGGSDDLGLYGTVAGIKLSTGDIAGSSVTRKAGFVVFLPECYDAGQDVQIRLSAGTIGGTADVSSTVDCEVFKINRAGGVGSDLVTTAAQSANSESFTNKDFVVTASGLNRGDALILIVTVACNDTGGSGTLEAAIGAVDLLLDIRG